MTEADSVHSTPPLNSSASNVIDLSAARAAAEPAAPAPLGTIAKVKRLAPPPKSEEELDRESKIMRAAVTYTALNGLWNGAWIAEHTGNSTVAEIVVEGVCERRDAVLRKLTRLIRKTEAARTVEIWSLASVAKVVLNQNGDEESGRNLRDFEILFLQSMFELIERSCQREERSA
ncbi:MULTISPECIES: hypothetical protein [Bradyrhizobium]|uniref:hypothetical protein n=1 Tax=Bradyrhizobium TaxID=374 RepID=UPI001EDBC55C|nr:hypothetical protein [Bradyrhizobium zhengyangense]MCG2639670.1 hypothetical protein [Bradyrhizobium zhengyangense]